MGPTRPEPGFALWAALDDGLVSGLIRSIDLKAGTIQLTDAGLSSLISAAARAGPPPRRPRRSRSTPNDGGEGP